MSKCQVDLPEDAEQQIQRNVRAVCGRRATGREAAALPRVHSPVGSQPQMKLEPIDHDTEREV